MSTEPKKIDWWEPQVGEKEKELLLQVLESNFLNDGEFTTHFENKLKELLGCKHVVAVTNGTSALFLALVGCGIGYDDEVIVPDITFIATANAVTMTGAKPVFVDVGDDFNINPKLIEKKITKKTKAIVPMHWGGHLCDMNAICHIAKKNNLLIIEDSAQAFGGEINGRKAGSFSIAGAFSMNPMKPLSGYGEGGLVVTDNVDIYNRIKILRYAGTTSDPKKLITNK